MYISQESQQLLKDTYNYLKNNQISGMPDELESDRDSFLVDIGNEKQLEVKYQPQITQRWWSPEYAFEDGSDDEDERRGWLNLTTPHTWKIRKSINGVWYGGVNVVSIEALQELCDTILSMGGSRTDDSN